MSYKLNFTLSPQGRDQRNAMKRFGLFFIQSLKEEGYVVETEPECLNFTVESHDGSKTKKELCKLLSIFHSTFRELDENELENFFSEMLLITTDWSQLDNLITSMLVATDVFNEGGDSFWAALHSISEELDSALQVVQQLNKMLAESHKRQQQLESAVCYLFSKEPNADYNDFFTETNDTQGVLQ